MFANGKVELGPGVVDDGGVQQKNARAAAGGSGGVGAQKGRCAEVAPHNKGRRCDRAQRDLQFCIRSIHSFGSRDDGCRAFIDAFTFKLRINRSRAADPAAMLDVLGVKVVAADACLAAVSRAMTLSGGWAFGRRGGLERIFRVS